MIEAKIGKLAPPTDLSPKDKAALNELLQSRGWQVYSKMVNELLGSYGRFCTQSAEDVRFWQGAYQALEAILTTPEMRLQLSEMEEAEAAFDIEEVFRQNQTTWEQRHEY